MASYDEGTKQRKINEYDNALTVAAVIFNDAVERNECPSEDPNTYDCISLIGRGAWGLVYKILRGAQFYALKVMVKRTIRQVNLQEHAIKEKQFLYAMNNPFVVKVLGKYKDRIHLYLIMECAPYGDLDFFIRRFEEKGVPEKRTRQVLCQVVLGLEYVHACDVIIRDLKPQNILMFENGRVKLSDFGLACLSTSRPNEPYGSLSWRAPEMFLSVIYSEAVDWWALGVTMYGMLICKGHPFFDYPGGARDEDFLKRIEDNDINFSQPEWGEITEEAKSLIGALLEKDPTRRIGTKFNGSEDCKYHAWFSGLDWYNVIYGEEQFNTEPQNGGRSHSIPAQSPKPFKDIAPNEADPSHAIFRDY